MFRPRSARNRGSGPSDSRFALYVEGPRDRDILRLFACKLSPQLAREMDHCTEILGGRRPRRAAELFRRLTNVEGSAASSSARGLCVLDRDGAQNEGEVFPDEPSLDFFVWNRRHIESYLLVPGAICRCLEGMARNLQLEHYIDETLPDPRDEDAMRQCNAKHLLGEPGPIATILGRPLCPREIVRCMSPNDVHADVRDLLTAVRVGLEREHPKSDDTSSS